MRQRLNVADKKDWKKNGKQRDKQRNDVEKLQERKQLPQRPVEKGRDRKLRLSGSVRKLDEMLQKGKEKLERRRQSVNVRGKDNASAKERQNKLAENANGEKKPGVKNRGERPNVSVSVKGNVNASVNVRQRPKEIVNVKQLRSESVSAKGKEKGRQLLNEKLLPPGKGKKQLSASGKLNGTSQEGLPSVN